jgi:hypothetical protein
MCSQYLYNIHPPNSLPTSPISPLVPTPQAGPVLPSYSRKWHFCLFKIAIQGVSLWHFRTYVLEPELAHLLYFSPFYLSPLLMLISTGLKFLCSFLYRKHINHIHLLSFLLLPFLSQ